MIPIVAYPYTRMNQINGKHSISQPIDRTALKMNSGKEQEYSYRVKHRPWIVIIEKS